MKSTQIGIQLYTVRDYLADVKQIAQTCKKLKDFGYAAAELCGLPISDDEIIKILGDSGLTCCSTHEGVPDILNEPVKVAARVKSLGAKYTCLPHPGGFNTLAEVQAFVKKLDTAGKVMAEAGVSLCYHNHSIEFRRFDGKLMLEEIYNGTDPKHLKAEIDTYWVQYGGGTPQDWVKRLAGRMPLLHLKDLGMNDKADPTYMEVGSGNLDWKTIIAAAEVGGCEWYIVEQDFCAGDPFDSVKKSCEYIRTQLIS
jgi:sugar phosphate isomerase/epimerase